MSGGFPFYDVRILEGGRYKSNLKMWKISINLWTKRGIKILWMLYMHATSDEEARRRLAKNAACASHATIAYRLPSLSGERQPLGSPQLLEFP